MERLRQLDYHDRARALREIGELSRHLPPTVMERLDLLLGSSPSPEEGLRYFARLHERQPAAFTRLTLSVEGLRYLIAVFTHSRFLSEEILQHPEWAAQLLEADGVRRVLDAEDYRELLDTALTAGAPRPLEFARFRRQQTLRILLRDLLQLASLPEVTGELTALADAIVETAYRRIYARLIAEYGVPRSEAGEESKFTVIALGKMGGQELNYSSDIDLMFLYSANGETDGGETDGGETDGGETDRPQRISNKEFFRHVANQLTELLSTATPEGMCYRVDLRLRPDGSLGEVCISLEGARDYYSKRARDWELQMMIKARVAAGDKATGAQLLDFVEPHTYGTTLDFSAVESLSLTRERLNEKLAGRERKHLGIDVKLARGGIRDIEFLVQCLQRLYGGAEPWVRQGGTLLALARLQDKGFLSDAEYGRLASAYQFLRQLEHRLQFRDDRQTHSLPADENELEHLASSMQGGTGTGEWLMGRVRAQFAQVTEIYDRVVHSRTAGDAAKPGDYPLANVVRALEQRAPKLAAALARGTLHRGFRAFEHFLERISSDPARLSQLESSPLLTERVFDLFEHSPYYAEELIRTPELIDEVAHIGEPPEPAPAAPVDLRRWYRRVMLRAQAASICVAEPVFETLERTSQLADEVIARAYEIALTQERVAHPPADENYRPSNQMWVVALGRLGMLEFDLASDADLVFVLADTDANELEFWTHVARQLANSIMAYTGEGMLFAVDTRLRPNGGDGPLVLTERSFQDYFTRAAEAWEGITYMKSRVVAGDARKGERFLHRLQEIDWQRYGQSGRSRLDLRQMRMKIEKEQGAAQPLKAGRGGYYDIDFILMYLRLKSAGVYYKVLNTPERIDVLKVLGHLDRAEADFLREAATFYRALDHGIRVLTGHADAKLPSSESQVDILNVVLKRWTRIPLSELEEIRSRTRAVFERTFG